MNNSIKKIVVTIGVILFILPFLMIPVIGFTKSDFFSTLLDQYFFAIPICSFAGMGLIIGGNFIGYKKNRENLERQVQTNINNDLDEKICMGCGNIIDNDSLYCKFCGKKQ